MKILLATGVPELDSAIESRINGMKFLGSVLYKEAVIDSVETKKPDVIILSEILEGVTPMRELVLALRTRFPEVRIIYLLKDENPREEAFLYHWMVFDVFIDSFTIPELELVLHNPKEFKDIHHRLKELDVFKKEIEEDENNLTGMMGINGGEYDRIHGPDSGTDTLYQQIISFWSVLDQSGKTFSIVNSALALAGRRELKILLLDFNMDNPNVNLYFSFVDPDRNLGAMVEDVERGLTINAGNLDNYLITHPTYNNLKILPGMILRLKKRDGEFMYKLFEDIVSAAEQSNYTTILVDTSAGFKDDVNAKILKRSNRILLHVSENPGSLNALHRFFDPQIGPFIEKLIDKKKIVAIMTDSTEENRNSFRRAIQGHLEIPVGVMMENSPDIRTSLFKGVPLLSKKTNEDMYNNFIFISNIIHKNIFKKPIVRKVKPVNTKNSKTNKQSPKISNPSNSGDMSMLGKLFKKK